MLGRVINTLHALLTLPDAKSAGSLGKIKTPFSSSALEIIMVEICYQNLSSRNFVTGICTYLVSKLNKKYIL